MQSFLEKIAQELVKAAPYYNKIVVLPNKRSGVFLKKALIELEQKPVLTPQIVSIQEFITSLSPYQSADWLTLLFEFFQVYKKVYQDKAQTFDEFIKWGSPILTDFNEIDAFNVDAKEVFTYIHEVKKIEDWQLKPDSPKPVKDYLQFYASLYDLYAGLQKQLDQKKIGYSGMISRKVAEQISELSKKFEAGQIIFAGFNALTNTEETIIKELLQQDKAKIFWDADSYYMKPPFEAGKFLRKHQQTFPTFHWLSHHFSEPKNIEIIGVPGNSTQAQAVAQIIDNKLKAQETSLDNIAVVLNEDELLLPVLNAIPSNIDAVNVTLGLGLQQVPISSLFTQILQIHADREQYGQYNIDSIINLWRQSFFIDLLAPNEKEAVNKVLQQLESYKTNQISTKNWQLLIQDSLALFTRFFKSRLSVTELLQMFIDLIDSLSTQQLNEINQLALVSLEKIFVQLQEFIRQTNEIKNIKTLKMLFDRFLFKERLAFEGEPLEGLQIMGILETRLLDFEQVIITSMNEGIIPKGKNERSVIPFELKKHFGLPQHNEHNAVIAYHFYRLLQRAKKITLIYNTAENGMGNAEPSRFITQLENELNPEVHHIQKTTLNLSAAMHTLEPEHIKKTDKSLEILRKIAAKGFSPSALSNYISNPVKYYQKYILGLEDSEPLSDVIPAYAMGNIIHNVMETLYTDKLGKILQKSDLEQMLQTYESLSLQYFIKESFGPDAPVKQDLIQGKNLIIFEIIKQNIKDLLKLDLKLIKQGHQLEIVSLEKELRAKLPIAGQDVYIRGKVDRIDRLNGYLRIIDYKTGKVENQEISIGKKSTLSNLIADENKAKLFQLLTYAWLYYKSGGILTTDIPFATGILSTRRLKSGLLQASVFGSTQIDVPVLKEFEEQLVALVTEILNPDVPFIEKESKY